MPPHGKNRSLVANTNQQVWGGYEIPDGVVIGNTAGGSTLYLT